MDADAFEELMIHYVDIREFGNTVLQQELHIKVEKEIGLASLNAKERLIQFREKYHFLENLISHVDIASYLGITNISLSRFRKDLMK
jgi:CRP-like cAMP-binding protein